MKTGSRRQNIVEREISLVSDWIWKWSRYYWTRWTLFLDILSTLSFCLRLLDKQSSARRLLVLKLRHLLASFLTNYDFVWYANIFGEERHKILWYPFTELFKWDRCSAHSVDLDFQNNAPFDYPHRIFFIDTRYIFDFVLYTLGTFETNITFAIYSVS